MHSVYRNMIFGFIVSLFFSFFEICCFTDAFNAAFQIVHSLCFLSQWRNTQKQRLIPYMCHFFYSSKGYTSTFPPDSVFIFDVSCSSGGSFLGYSVDCPKNVVDFFVQILNLFPLDIFIRLM